MGAVTVDARKLIISLAAIVSMVVLGLFGKVDATASHDVIVLVLGYTLGNGVSVRSGNSPGTLLDVKDQQAPE